MGMDVELRVLGDVVVLEVFVQPVPRVRPGAFGELLEGRRVDVGRGLQHVGGAPSGLVGVDTL